VGDAGANTVTGAYGDSGYPYDTGDGDTSYLPSSGDGGTTTNGQPLGDPPSANGTDAAVGDVDAGTGLGGLGDIFGNLGSASDAGTAEVGDGGMCQGLVCFDVFDCFLWHPSEAPSCGFTACEAFVCK
jgi:hypothetical protein